MPTSAGYKFASPKFLKMAKFALYRRCSDLRNNLETQIYSRDVVTQIEARKTRGKACKLQEQGTSARSSLAYAAQSEHQSNGEGITPSTISQQPKRRSLCASGECLRSHRSAIKPTEKILNQLLRFHSSKYKILWSVHLEHCDE
jgi:hypothetical protein